MRKFRNRFAAIVAAAMTGIMTFGLVATAAPVVGVYAAKGDYVISADKPEVTAGEKSTVNLSATLEGEDGQTSDATADLTFDVTYTGVSIEGSVMTIESTASEGTVTVSAKNGSSEEVGTVDVVIKKANDDSETGETKYSLDASVQYDAMILKVKTSDPYFTVDVLKTESDKEKPSKSYTYANSPAKKPTAGGSTEPSPAAETASEYVEIDLGFLKLKNENILNIYGSSVTDKSKGTIVKVAAQPAKEKLTVDAKESTLPAALGKAGTEYQYKTANGGFWTSIDQFDFTAAKVAGTTLVVRKTAVDKEGSAAPAGPEIKVKIPASPKAPKVTVDYTKDNVKVTDKMEIALLENAPIKEDDKTAAGWQTAAKGMTRDQIAEKVGKKGETGAFTIVVRTAASGKKSASMPVIVQIKEVSQLKGDQETNPSSATIKIDESTTATIEAKKTDKGVTFTTKGATFQYDKGGNKWANITSGKEIKISAATVDVRVAPEKEDKKTPGSGEFPSSTVTLTPAETKTDDDKTEGSTSKVSKVEVTSANTVTVAESGDTTLALTATVTAAEGVTLAENEQGVNWSVKSALAEDGETDIKDKVSIASGDVLTIASDVAKADVTVVVTATPKADASKAVDVTITVVASGN